MKLLLFLWSFQKLFIQQIIVFISSQVRGIRFLYGLSEINAKLLV